MIMAKPAHTMPRMRAEKLLGAPEGRGLGQLLEAGMEQTGATCSLTFPDAGVEQDTPGEPHGRRQGQSILLLFLTVHLEPAKGAAGCRGQAGERAERQPCPSPVWFSPPPAPPKMRVSSPLAALT